MLSVSVILVAAELDTCDDNPTTAHSAAVRSASPERRVLVNTFTAGPPFPWMAENDVDPGGPTSAESMTTPLQRSRAHR